MLVKSKKDILILTPYYRQDELGRLKENYILSVDSEATLKQLQELDKRIQVHIYVNLGMNRFGVKPERVSSFIKYIEQNCPNLIIDGMYGHLNNTEDKEYTIDQIKRFGRLVYRSKNKISKIHLLNSEGFKSYNEYADFDNMIRVGDMLYNNKKMMVSTRRCINLRQHLYV